MIEDTNGTSGAISIYRGDTVTINASGYGHVKDWVGLYPVGVPNGYPYYSDWYYLNGAKSIPSSPVGSATFPFPIQVPPGNYEFRLHRGDTYAVIGTTGIVTVQTPTMNVSGVVAPQTLTATPGGTIQVNVFGGTGHPQDWVGIYRVGTADNAWIDWVWLSGTRNPTGAQIQTTSFPMTVPLPRGPYEVRWFFANSYARVATSTTIDSEVRTLADAGDGHTLLVRPGTDSAWSAGLNDSGQLGDGTVTDRALPMEIAGLSTVVSVAAGASHSLAVTDTGAIYAWGSNDAGQLGDGTTTERTTPTQLSLSDVVAIAAGDQHSVALTASGQVYTWGLNSSGQLGHGTTTNSAEPILLATGVIAIGTGDQFTLFVKADGTVWGTGHNEGGTLGDGTYTNRTSPVESDRKYRRAGCVSQATLVDS